MKKSDPLNRLLSPMPPPRPWLRREWTGSLGVSGVAVLKLHRGEVETLPRKFQRGVENPSISSRVPRVNEQLLTEDWGGL
jgi:hypothetical protein